MNSFFAYLQENLGVDHVILPLTVTPVRAEPSHAKAESSSHPPEQPAAISAAETLAHSLHVTTHVDVHFQIVSAHELSTAEHTLFHKIMEALKLPSHSYIMTSGPTEVEPKAKKTVIFTDLGERMGEWLTHDGVTSLRTYSLHAMLQDASLKKPVWNQLQSLKQA